MKMQTKYYKDNTIAYDDKIDNLNLKFKKNGKYCEPKTILKDDNIVLLLILDKDCEVIKGKYYTSDGKFIQNLEENQKKSLSLKIQKYLKNRTQINQKLFSTPKKIETRL